MASVSNSKLYQFDAGIQNAQDACVVIVRTEWNAAQVDLLESGCRKVLEKAGVKMIHSLTVPGAFEIPFGIRAFWERSKYLNDRPCIFIALACIIQGGTPHFEYVCRAITDGVLQLNLSLPVPVIYGVLTVLNEKQAMDRLGGPEGHKGEEAAVTALKMIALQQSYQQK